MLDGLLQNHTVSSAGSSVVKASIRVFAGAEKGNAGFLGFMISSGSIGVAITATVETPAWIENEDRWLGESSVCSSWINERRSRNTQDDPGPSLTKSDHLRNH